MEYKRLIATTVLECYGIVRVNVHVHVPVLTDV